MELIHGEFRNKTVLYFDNDLIIKLGKMAAKIAYHNFEWRYITLIMFKSINALGLQVFLISYKKSLVIQSSRFYAASTMQFVIFGKEASEISNMIEFLVKSKYDSTGRFLIICASRVHECEENTIFQTLAKNYVVNAVVLKISRQRKKPIAYSYDIVLPGNCKNDKPEEIDLINNCINDTCYKKMYPDKLTNFYKCRLVISSMEQPPFMYIGNGTKDPSGFDGDIMKLVANMLNATLVIKTAKDGSEIGYYRNNNWTGCFGELYNGRARAAACSAPLTANTYGNFQISYTYFSMDIVWAAKLPEQKSSWEKLIHPLKIQIRVILFFMFIGIIFMDACRKTKIWRKIRKVFRIKGSNHNLLFYSWMLFLGMPSLKMPKKMSFKLMVYAWIWFCFVVRSAYQAILINSLKIPVYFDQLETLYDFVNSRHPYGGPTSFREYYSDDRYIYENWIIYDSSNFSKALDGILNNSSNLVIAANKEVIKYFLMNSNSSNTLQIIPEKIVNSPTVVYFKKYSPLTTPMSRVLRIAMESGLVDRVYKYNLYDKVLQRQTADHKMEPLNLKDFAGCFLLIITGWWVSAIYFAIEIISGNLDDGH